MVVPVNLCLEAAPWSRRLALGWCGCGHSTCCPCPDTLLALPWCPPRSFYSTWPSRSAWFSSWRPWHATQAGRYKVLGFGTLPGPPALPGCRHGGPGTQCRLVEGKSLTKCRLSEGTLFRWDTQSAGFQRKGTPLKRRSTQKALQERLCNGMAFLSWLACPPVQLLPTTTQRHCMWDDLNWLAWRCAVRGSSDLPELTPPAMMPLFYFERDFIEFMQFGFVG